MTTSLSNFTNETQLTTDEALMVSTQNGVSAAPEKKFIGMATVTNTSASNVDVTVWRTSTGTAGTVGSGGNWLWNKTIPANSTMIVDKIIGHVLGVGMKISALASVTGVVNVDISGTTET
jgi:hypothetical protein